MRFVVEVDLALHRPVAVHRTSRVVLDAPDALWAEKIAISAAVQSHQAEMALGSRIIDWEE